MGRENACAVVGYIRQRRVVTASGLRGDSRQPAVIVDRLPANGPRAGNVPLTIGEGVNHSRHFNVGVPNADLVKRYKPGRGVVCAKRIITTGKF